MIFRLSDNIDKDWEIAKTLLRPAFCRVFHLHDIDEYYPVLKNGFAQLWIAEDDKIRGAIVTSIDEGTNGKILEVRDLGGSKLRKWSQLMEDMLTKFAQMNGCRHIEAVTRKGFSRLVTSFKPQGLDLFIKVV